METDVDWQRQANITDEESVNTWKLHKQIACLVLRSVVILYWMQITLYVLSTQSLTDKQLATADNSGQRVVLISPFGQLPSVVRPHHNDATQRGNNGTNGFVLAMPVKLYKHTLNS